MEEAHVECAEQKNHKAKTILTSISNPTTDRRKLGPKTTSRAHGPSTAENLDGPKARNIHAVLSSINLFFSAAATSGCVNEDCITESTTRQLL
jgi:hypothetical protein